MLKNNCLIHSNENLDAYTKLKNEQTNNSNILNTHNINVYETMKNICNKSCIFLLILSMTYCEPNTIFYVTPKFAILPVPLEMTAYIIDMIMKENSKNDKYCYEFYEQQNDEIANKNPLISQYEQTTRKCLAHLLKLLPDCALSIDEKNAIYDLIYRTNEEETRNAINTTNINAYYHPNIYVTSIFMKEILYNKYKIDNGINYHFILQLLNRIYQPITNENQNILYTLQNKLKNLWIRKIVTEYIEKNHFQIDTKDSIIEIIEVDMYTYGNADKLDYVISSINNTVLGKNMSNAYVLLEPLYILHSMMSFSYKIDVEKYDLRHVLFISQNYTEYLHSRIKNTEYGDKIVKLQFILRVDYTVSQLDNFYKETRANDEQKNLTMVHLKLIIDWYFTLIGNYKTVIYIADDQSYIASVKDKSNYVMKRSNEDEKNDVKRIKTS